MNAEFRINRFRNKTIDPVLIDKVKYLLVWRHIADNYSKTILRSHTRRMTYIVQVSC